MRRNALLAIALVGLTAGCNLLPFGGDEEEPEAAPPTPPPAAEPQAQPAPPPQQPTPAPAPQLALQDEPWTPTATGTVTPGMTQMDVVAVWGEPVLERVFGARTYLYYRNGCEVTCGTYDVVFLENDQVVDAVVRWSGHIYAGVSSSPADRAAEPTLPALPPGGTGASP
jgi:hypothetical protein